MGSLTTTTQPAVGVVEGGGIGGMAAPAWFSEEEMVTDELLLLKTVTWPPLLLDLMDGGGGDGVVGLGAGTGLVAGAALLLQGVPRSRVPFEKAPHSGTPQNPDGGQGSACTRQSGTVSISTTIVGEIVAVALAAEGAAAGLRRASCHMHVIT